MRRCLSERALVRLYLREGTATQQFHVRMCADCAERYEELIGDLDAIGQVLKAPPPAGEIERVSSWRLGWMPAAIACAVLVVLVLDAAWLRHSSPVELAVRTSNVSAFATDLSDALFGPSDTSAIPAAAIEAPYLEAALEAGQPCTRERLLNGECNDEVSAFLSESEWNEGE
jgi:hypothetical protein